MRNTVKTIIKHRDSIPHAAFSIGHKSINKHQFIFVLLSLISLPLYFFTIAGIRIYLFMVPAIVIMQVFLFFKLKNVPIFFLFTVYSFIYFIYLIPYFYFGMKLTEWRSYHVFEYFSLVCFHFYVFYCAICLSISSPPNPQRRWLKNKISHRTSNIAELSITVLTMLTVIYLYIFGGDNVLAEDNPYMAYQENLSKSNAMGLFVLIFLAISWFSISNVRLRNFFFFIISGFIAYYALTRGYRVILAPLGFLYLLLYLEQKLSSQIIVVIAVLGLCFLGFVNSLKMGQDFSILSVFSESDDFILSHQADELYGSAIANGLILTGEISIWDRIALQIATIGQAIIPPSLFPTSMRFPMVLSEFTSYGGGGLYITGVSLMFGEIGLFIITYLLSKFIQLAYITNNKCLTIFAFFVLMFSPNWFSYDLNVILRFPIIGLIVYCIIGKLNLGLHRENNISYQ